jgi:hypothetical protein
MSSELPPEEGRHKVRVHTPDKRSYHQGDSGRTVIPRAKAGTGGASEGFNVLPGIVVVEPDNLSTGAGGISVDYSKCTNAMINLAWKKVRDAGVDEAEQVIKVHQLLNHMIAAKEKPPEPAASEPIRPTTNSVYPNAYVTPASNRNGSQMSAPKPARVRKKVRKQPALLLPTEPEEIEAEDYEYYDEPPQPTGPDPQVMQMMEGMQQQISMMAEMFKHKQVEPTPADEVMSEEDHLAVLSEEKEAEPTAEETIPKRQALAAVGKAFESLDIPGLSYEPDRPKYRVIFDLGPAGIQSAWYHWVSKNSKGLFLVYDTRFTFGMEYYPPDTGETVITVSLPDQEMDYRCYSNNFVHTFGTFRIVNLLLADSEGGPVVDHTNLNDTMSKVTSVEQLLGDL